MKIVKMYEYGGFGWEFCIMGKEWYRTSEYGFELWHYCWNGSAYSIDADGNKSKYYEYKQILGASQFFLPQNRNSAYKRIRRYFAKEIEDLKLDIEMGRY